MTTLTHLECSVCKKTREAGQVHNLCECGGPLLVRYDLEKARATWSRDDIVNGPPSMWRYAPVLPVRDRESVVSLGEGLTPLIKTKRLGAHLGAADLYVKDEGLNPTGSFKARGLSCAVSMCLELGIRKLAIPTAGNAGSALAAYAAAAGIEAHIFMPRDVPQANYIDSRAFGAHVTLVDGLISDCGRIVAERKNAEGWFDVSTLKEPYRIEGKKTMGYELWEQLGGKLPDVILYPTGGGVGLIGMCKAFDEMQEMGWIGEERPRMVAVQAEGCAPIVRAWEAQHATSEFFQNAATLASGLRVPGPLGDFLILRMLKQTHGTALTVTDDEMLQAGKELASLEGIFAAPEGAATVSATRKLAASGWIKPHETVVLFNTGTGYKYSEAWQRALQA
jgi:threonine synthase